MIKEITISMSEEILDDLEAFHGVKYNTVDAILFCIGDAIGDNQIINVDDVKRRESPDTFSTLMTLKVTYDDEETATNAENKKTIELEMVANEI